MSSRKDLPSKRTSREHTTENNQQIARYSPINPKFFVTKSSVKLRRLRSRCENLTQHRLASDVFNVLKDLPFARFIFPPHKPVYNVTALELRYRLILSPVPDAGWHHHTAPVTRNGHTERWQTRCSTR